MTAVRFVEGELGWTTINFRYDPDLVAIVKQLSGSVREYDPPTKTWRVLDAVAPKLADAMQAAGHVVLAGEEPEPAPAPQRDRGVASFFGIDSTNDGYDPKLAAAEFIASVPAQHLHKVFRALARELYPDLYRKQGGR